MKTQIHPTPIVSGKKAEEIKKLLTIEANESTEEGKEVLQRMFDKGRLNQMVYVKCNLEDCYWRMDGHCSLHGIEISNGHCANYRTYNQAEIIEHPGFEDEHYLYCSKCGFKDICKDDKYCSQCGVKFKR